MKPTTPGVKKEFIIIDEIGIHARPATLLVGEATKYVSAIEIGVGENGLVNLKSIMGVMSLGAKKDSSIIITCQGTDEKEAMDAIVSVLKEQKIAIEK